VVIYKEEIFDDNLINEMLPLLVKHKDEICLYEDFDLDPDWGAYKRLQELGMFKIFTARNEDKLIGYVAFAIHHNLHYRARKHAVQDVLYLDPTHRGRMMGVKLIKFADDVLRDNGVHLVSQHVKIKHDFSPLLEYIGYEQVEKIYERRLN